MVLGRFALRHPVGAPLAYCKTTGCRGRATVLCDYPVTRNGRKTRCSRHVCARCATPIGDRQLCPPHARIAGPGVLICAACFSSSCAHGDAGFVCAGREAAGTRVVTDAEWHRLLSFGAL